MGDTSDSPINPPGSSNLVPLRAIVSTARCLENQPDSGESANPERFAGAFVAAHAAKMFRGERYGADFPKLNWTGLDCTHAECLPPETAVRRAGAGGGGQPNPDRRVYVSIKPDARGINLGKGTAESVAEGSIDRAD